MSELVTPHVALGGIKTAYVMPNLLPPITSTEQAMSYKKDLQKLAPETEFLMTLYLHENMLEEIEVQENGSATKVLRGVHEIRKASKAGVRGMSAVTVNCEGNFSFLPKSRNQVIPSRRDHALLHRH